MIAIDASRICWYSRSVSVCAGATVIESPVCTPIASKFSMEHTITQLSLRSRMTSISNSFQPSTLSSTSTSPIGESASPCVTMSRSSSTLYAMPPPAPPSVKLGRMTTGKPMPATISSASASEYAYPLRGVSSPMRAIASANRRLSSPFLMTSTFAPISSTP